MITFYILAVGLAMLALGFIFYPVFKRNYAAHTQAFTLSNTRLIKQRLVELDEEFAQGIISDKHRTQAQKDLKIALLDETRPESDTIAVDLVNNSHTSKIASALLVLLLLASGVMYWHVNQVSGVSGLYQAQADMQRLTDKIIVNPSEDVTLEDVQSFTLAIRSRIAHNAEDATGWMLLGRLYGALNQFEQAYQAFDKSLLIAPNNTETLSSYAQALMMPNQVEFLKKTVVVLRRLLVLEPDNNQAALMLSMTAGQLGDVATSEQYFMQIKALLPPNNPAIVQIQARLDELKGQSQVATGFSITISADKDINTRLAQSNRLQPTYLFVFAKDGASDNPLPAAVKKLNLGALPTTVTLTNSDAMMATYSLNDLTEVTLTARLSFDENVQTSVGELEGSITLTKVADAVIPVSIIINKEIKQ
jgi:cytochrome c-type biogenesis protein CcmI